MRNAVFAFAFLLLTSLGAGCGNDSSTPTTPSTSTAPTTEVFTGSLDVKGSSFYSFSVLSTGTVSVMLASITLGSPSAAAAIPVSLGVGVPAGLGCGVTTAVTVAPALTSQIANSLTAGIYCVNIADIGNLTAPVNFAIRIVHR